MRQRILQNISGPEFYVKPLTLQMKKKEKSCMEDEMGKGPQDS